MTTNDSLSLTQAVDRLRGLAALLQSNSTPSARSDGRLLDATLDVLDQLADQHADAHNVDVTF